MHILAKLIVAGAALLSTCLVNPEVVKKEKSPPEPLPAADSDKPAKGQVVFEVVGVNDGDTVTVLLKTDEEKKQRKIRLATIDAPEYNQPFGKKSRRHLSDLVYRKEITINKMGQDRYGRIIAEIFVDGKNINVEQIRNGYAWHYKRHQRQQTYEQRIVYSQAQNEAKEKRLGIWQLKKPIPPWAYRKRNPRKTENKRMELLTEQDYD